MEEQEDTFKRNETSRRSRWDLHIQGSENISEKINRSLEENASEIEKVIDVKLSTLPFSLPVKQINR